MYRNSKASWREPTPQRFPKTQYQNRAPLYPIGPTLSENYKYTQIYGGTNFPRPNSPAFVINNKQPIQPSYESRMMQRQERISHNPNFEQRQRKLIALNQTEIQGETRRRQALRASYERQIERITNILNKNSQRKDKLKSQIQILTADGKELAQKLQQYRAPDYEKPTGLELKQQELLRLKTQLINQMRLQQQQLVKQRQTEENEWQERLKEKQKVLLSTEQRRNYSKNQLLKAKREQIEKLIEPSIEDRIKQKKYEEFLYDFDVIQQKINRIQLERENSTRQIKEREYQKIGIIKDQIVKISELRKQKLSVDQKIIQISNRNKQIEKANQNLEQEDNRKEQLINQYENDIKDIKYTVNKNEGQYSTLIDNFRNREQDNFITDLPEEIERLQKSIREVQNENFRLKADFQKLTELLNSSVSKSIYQTFNQMQFV